MIMKEIDRSVQLQNGKSFALKKYLNLLRIQLKRKLFKRESNQSNAIDRLQICYKDQEKGNS